MKLRKFVQPAGHNCSFSTGFCGITTAGTGVLSDYGYWEFPCVECCTLMAYAAREIRVVHNQRARKLRRRGVRVNWSPIMQAYIWEPRNAT